MKLRYASLVAAASVATLFSLAACSSDNTTPSGNGGSSSGGASSGGAASGGAASGGKPASGGQTGSGGAASGGAASGGATGSGGSSSGGMTGSGGQSKGGQTGSGGQANGGGSSGGSSSGGGSAGGSSVPATFQTFRDTVHEKCGGSGCHNDPMNPFPMKWDDTMLYTTITTHKVTKCSNMQAISPGKPQESAIIKVLSGTCGSISRMPPPPSCDVDSMGGCVDPDVIAALTKWVMDGAKQQ